jgi:glycosyltransferase involved in cell wall biosynthesis
MAIPSRSEGLSRAALEALHLGVPCVLRDTDGNGELVRPGVNGILFHDDADLADAVAAGAKLGRMHGQRESLLPEPYRQHYAARQYLQLVDSL